MNKNRDNKKDKYSKIISRLLYKLNSNITESEEFIQYKKGISDYYPENISDISPSFVLSLTIMISLLQKEGITEVTCVPYLKVKYLSRLLVSNNANTDLQNRGDFIQKNATDKFIRTFRRVANHINGLTITSYPYELDENLHLKLDNKVNINNEILNQVFDYVNHTK